MCIKALYLLFPLGCNFANVFRKHQVTGKRIVRRANPRAYCLTSILKNMDKENTIEEAVDRMVVYLQANKGFIAKHLKQKGGEIRFEVAEDGKVDFFIGRVL